MVCCSAVGEPALYYIPGRFLLEAKAVWGHTCIAGGLFFIADTKIAVMSWQYTAKYKFKQLTDIGGVMVNVSRMRIFQINKTFLRLALS